MTSVAGALLAIVLLATGCVPAVGPDGQILSQRVVWSPGLLGSWGRTYFEAPMEPAPGYRVRVFSYDRVETDRRRGPFW